jgi:putative oxidoreductase
LRHFTQVLCDGDAASFKQRVPDSHARVENGYVNTDRGTCFRRERKNKKWTADMTVRSASPSALSALDGVAASTSDALLLIGRIMLGFIFLRSGYGKLFDIGAVAASFPPRGLPAFMAYISVPAEFFGGLALILGLASRYFAVVVFIFTVVATFSSHRYWDFAEVAARRVQEVNFYKNVAIMGGILVLFVGGAGRFSLDALFGRRA